MKPSGLFHTSRLGKCIFVFFVYLFYSCDIKYSYLILLICTQLYGFKYSYQILMIYTHYKVSSNYFYSIICLKTVIWFQVSNNDS